MKKTNSLSKLLIFSALIFIFFQSCKNDNAFETIQVNNQYSVGIPLILTKAQTLHDEASLQYQNLLQELYVIVIDDPKNEIHDMINEEEALSNFSPDFDGYAKLITENMELRIQLENVSELKDTVINGHKAKIQTMETQIEGHKAYYMMCLLEGRKNYYQMITWTLKEKQKLHEKKMNNMIFSFKELKK